MGIESDFVVLDHLNIRDAYRLGNQVYIDPDKHQNILKHKVVVKNGVLHASWSRLMDTKDEMYDIEINPIERIYIDLKDIIF